MGRRWTARALAAADALRDYLATTPAAAPLRTATFVPAETPRGYGPVQAAAATTTSVMGGP